MGTALQNGYTQMFVEFFERFPVPVKRLDGNADASRLDAEVLRLQSEASDATTEATIDALVEALYCVTSEERQALEVWKSRRRSALDEQVTVADE
jgi:hypothetical protein